MRILIQIYRDPLSFKPICRNFQCIWFLHIYRMIQMISSIDLTGICVLPCLQYCHFCLQRNFCHFSLLRDIFLSTENSSFFSDCI